jgi:hypothetical protein
MRSYEMRRHVAARWDVKKVGHTSPVHEMVGVCASSGCIRYTSPARPVARTSCSGEARSCAL